MKIPRTILLPFIAIISSKKEAVCHATVKMNESVSTHIIVRQRKLLSTLSSCPEKPPKVRTECHKNRQFCPYAANNEGYICKNKKWKKLKCPKSAPEAAAKGSNECTGKLVCLYSKNGTYDADDLDVFVCKKKQWKKAKPKCPKNPPGVGKLCKTRNTNVECSYTTSDGGSFKCDDKKWVERSSTTTAPPEFECPKKMPEFGDSCKGSTTCSYSEQCCCGNCKPVEYCDCIDDKFEYCVVMDYCMAAHPCKDDTDCNGLGRKCVDGECCYGS